MSSRSAISASILAKSSMIRCRSNAARRRKLHVEDGLGLDLVDVEQLDQAGPRDVDGLRCADQRNDFVQCVKGFHQTAQDVRALVGLTQSIGGSAG